MRRLLEGLADRDDVCPAAGERLRQAAELVPPDVPLENLLYHLAHMVKRSHGYGPAEAVAGARSRQQAHERGECRACAEISEP